MCRPGQFHHQRDTAGNTASIAVGVRPVSLRSLDAIHLASALIIRRELTAFIAYDNACSPPPGKPASRPPAPRDRQTPLPPAHPEYVRRDRPDLSLRTL
jgi:hypothetical protein